jgi:hypothetical protein
MLLVAESRGNERKSRAKLLKQKEKKKKEAKVPYKQIKT